MKKLSCFVCIALSVTGTVGFAQNHGPLLGIVSIAPSEANNGRFIQGAQQQAAEYGWQVQVIDAQGAADQANTAIQNLVNFIYQGL
jgi:ribose transport system substrate-binding protein